MLAIYCRSDVGYHHHHCHKHHDIDQLLQVRRWRSDLGKRHMACSADSHRCQPLLTHPRISPHSFGIHNCLGEGHEMARGGNPTVVFDSTRRQVSWGISFRLFFCTFLSLIYFVSFHSEYPLFRWSCNSTVAPPTQMGMATLIVFQPLTTFRSYWK